MRTKKSIEEADALQNLLKGLVVFTRSTGSNYDDLDDFTKAMVKQSTFSAIEMGKSI